MPAKAATKPEILAAMGARGTGKTAWATRQPQYVKAKRLAVWDLMREAAHAQLPHTESLPEFIRWLKAPAFRVAFAPSPDDAVREQQFELWCRACLLAGHLTAHVEELAFVTKPHKAPPAWRRMILLGRYEPHVLTIIGTSQRPAQVDKEFIGNADVLHVGRLIGADAEGPARILGIKPAELENLPDLHWLERRQGDMKPTRGQLSFGAPAAPLRRVPKGGNLRTG